VPRRRKGIKYTRELPILLRDTQPTWREIDGEPNAHKRRERIRARDSAIDELMKIYRDAEKRGVLAQLDIRVRNFCEVLKSRHGGRLPKPKGGRPPDERGRFSLALEVEQTRDATGKKRGSIEQALKDVSQRRKLSYDYVRDVYYGPDRMWRLAIKAELALKKYEAAVDKSVKG
jgi:hypothetical protein